MYQPEAKKIHERIQAIKGKAGKAMYGDKAVLEEIQSLYFLVFDTYFQTGCGSCIKKAHDILINLSIEKIIEMKSQAYKLNPGALIRYKGDFYTRETITDKVAKALIKDFPEQAKQFEVIPADEVPKETKKTVSKKKGATKDNEGPSVETGTGDTHEGEDTNEESQDGEPDGQNQE